MNKLNLTRPICFFDLETTGVDIVSDRIVEIAILKIFPDSKKLSKSWLVNPIINIPDEASQIHGITNDKVSESPTFKEISNEIFEFIKNCDLAGFNSDRFDIPLLAEEFLRVNIDLNDARKVLENSGTALMGQAIASGENRAIEAVTEALDSPLLNVDKIYKRQKHSS